jgi:hypothetical protein
VRLLSWVLSGPRWLSSEKHSNQSEAVARPWRCPDRTPNVWLFLGPDVVLAHGLASAVTCRGADHGQLDAPPAASLRHDLAGNGPLKTGDRPVPRRRRVPPTANRRFPMPEYSRRPADFRLDYRAAFRSDCKDRSSVAPSSLARPRIGPRIVSE